KDGARGIDGAVAPPAAIARLPSPTGAPLGRDDDVRWWIKLAFLVVLAGVEVAANQCVERHLRLAESLECARRRGQYPCATGGANGAHIARREVDGVEVEVGPGRCVFAARSHPIADHRDRPFPRGLDM